MSIIAHPERQPLQPADIVLLETRDRRLPSPFSLFAPPASSMTRPLWTTVTDTFTPDQRSRLMSRVRTQGTKPELALRKALWSAGFRGWRCNARSVVGRPDLAWIGRRIAVFVDGAFWHGHPAYYHGRSGPFWDEKIARNRARDEHVNRELEAAGWTVLRLWDLEVESNLAECVRRVDRLIAGATERRVHGR